MLSKYQEAFKSIRQLFFDSSQFKCSKYFWKSTKLLGKDFLKKKMSAKIFYGSKHSTILRFASVANLEPKNALVAWNRCTAQKSAAKMTTSFISTDVKNFKMRKKMLNHPTRRKEFTIQRCKRSFLTKKWTNFWLVTSESVPRRTSWMSTRKGTGTKRSQRESLKLKKRSPKKVFPILGMAGRYPQMPSWPWCSLSHRKIDNKTT